MFRTLILAIALMASAPMMMANADEITLLPSVKL
ncbi:MAG: DUF2502 domain-containing protein, partial [Buttiauxella noackiae]|nr:DUF2502 domain-containing protein [Buttiauxella noackiae]